MSGIGGAEYRLVFAVETAPAIDFAVGERGLDAGLPRRVCLALPPPSDGIGITRCCNCKPTIIISVKITKIIIKIQIILLLVIMIRITKMIK